MSDDMDWIRNWRPLSPFDETWNLGPMDAKAEILMELAIEQMDRIANRLVEHDEPPISFAERRAACVRLCAEVFDRLHAKT
jgi:hypothetical protein